jgi:hypothetical protein
MAASSEEAPRKIPSRERTVAQMAIVFRGARFLFASKDCRGLSLQGEASIAFYPAFAHCDGSESLSLRHRAYLPFTTERRGWPEMSPFPKRTFCADVDCSEVAQKLSIAGSFESRPAGAQSSERYPATSDSDSRRRSGACDTELRNWIRQPVSSIRIAVYVIRMLLTIPCDRF